MDILAIFNYISIGIYTTMGLYHLLCYLKLKRITYLLYFCFSWSLAYAVFFGWATRPLNLSHIPIIKSLIVFSMFTNPFSFTLFIGNIYNLKKYLSTIKYFAGIIGLLAIASFFSSLLWNNFVIMNIYFISVIVYTFYSMFLITKSVLKLEKGKRKPKVLFGTILLAIMCGLGVIPFMLNLFWAEIWLQTAYMCALFIFADVLTDDFYDNHKELIKNKNELLNLNNDLELRVENRTAELKTAKDTIEQQEKVKTVFFTQLMHHLKTPLSNIRTVIQNERYNDDRSIEVARLNAYELYIEMDNYLVVEKYKNHGEYNYKHDSVVNISSLLNRVVDCFAIYNITANIAPELNVQINGDSFVRLVSCLLDNAVKYNRVGVNIEVELKAENEQAILTVKDDGVGITESVQANIFNPFYQLANKESNSQGIGMGLNVVKLTVDSAGGEVGVDSKEGEGASFICSFPLSSEKVSTSKTVKIDIEAGSDKTIDISDSAYLNERDNILIVEDNRSLIYTLKEILAEYNVFVALNGVEGLRRLEELTAEGRYINLILSDEMMDKMSGFEFVEKVRENELLSAIPFVFLTARTEFDDLLKGVRAGAVDYIRKPFERDEVRARVKRHIEHTFTVVDSYANDEKKLEYNSLEKVTIKYGLSGKQQEYAIHSAMGLETKEILAELNEEVNPKNINKIDSALRKVYKKLEVDDRQAMNKLLLDSKGDIT